MTTIFAPITFPAKSSVMVIRISGEETRKCLAKLGMTKALQANQVKLCKIFDEENSELIDEALVSFFQAPHSFTGQDVAEIAIHGSPFILKKVFRILSSQKNVRLAEAGEFSKIAFLNGKIDLVQAEAIPDLIAAETESQHRQAIKQMQGELGIIYDNWRIKIIELLALIESLIDFPDEDLPKNIINEIEKKIKILQTEISSHLNDNNSGQKIKDGLSLAIIGSPNVGKSSLLNFLAKSEVAIVSEIAGTTRDVIEVHLEIAGVAVRLADTAGLRLSKNKIENEGIKRAQKKASQADIKILVVDAKKKKLSPQDLDLIDHKTIVVANKIDLVRSSKISDLKAINISLKTKENLDLLINKIEEKVLENLPKVSSPLITQERYRQSLIDALEAIKNFSLEKNIELAAEDLRIASLAIGKITGRINVDDVLDVVFSKFCIGK